MKKFFLLCSVLLLLVPEAFAWGQKGHRVIAEIAYRHLSPLARHRVDKVLGERKGMVYWSNWADEIRSDTIYPNSFSWHYQDFDGGLSDSAVVAALTDYPAEGGDMLRVTDSMMVRLSHNRSERDNLRFLVHLYSDRFCPMHTAHLDDLGGNSVQLEWFRQKTNLHTVWDTQLIESQGYSYTEYAEMLEARYGRERKRIEQMTEEDVLLQNYHLTCSIYDFLDTWRTMDYRTYEYIYYFKDEMEWQLYTAGIRLAKILNRLY